MPATISIDTLAQPALIIDTDGPAIRAANAMARQLWGLDAATETPISLDPQMPAPARLRQDCRDGAAGAGRSIDTDTQSAASLVFWTAAGAQSLRCLMRPLGDPGDVLVIFEMTDEKPTGPASSSAHEPDAEITSRRPDASIDMAAMAHELRTPIGAIIALAEMIETEQFGAIGDPRYRDYARDIGDSARLSLSIVAAALEYGSADADLLSGFAELDVAELIDRSVRAVAQSASAAGIDLRQDVAADLPHLIANATGLTQILLNLLTNAIKFTPKDGTVTVATTRTTDAGLEISVSDTGVGMSGLDASVLIDAATERDRAPDGAAGTPRRRGIGFSLVRRLAGAMGAHFDVTSTRGVGTRVTLTFPPAKVIPVARTTDPT